MSQDIELPKIASVDSVKGVLDGEKRGRTNTSYTVTKSYRNTLGYPICIIDRSNIVATVPSSSYYKGSSELIIEHRINYSDNVNLNWDTVLNEANVIPTIEALRAVVKSTNVKVTALGQEFIVEYTITHATLSDNNFSAYLQELDLVVATTSKAYNVVHPFSATGQNLITSLDDNIDGFHYRVIINDPFGQFGERYVNVNDNVFRVRLTVDNTIKPGVYVYTKDECKNNNLYSPGFGSQFYTFDEADKNIPLYSTAHLAASLGDAHYKQEQAIKTMEGQAKERLAELNLRKIELDTELKNMEYKHKQETLTLESENIRLKDELDREKSMREQQTQRDKFEYDKLTRRDKDFFEKRSYERKDASEFLKWIPSIITGIIAAANIIAFMQKSKTKT